MSALILRTGNTQTRGDQNRALAHPDQSPVARVNGCVSYYRRGLGQTSTVVRDLDLQTFGRL